VSRWERASERLSVLMATMRLRRVSNALTTVPRPPRRAAPRPDTDRAAAAVPPPRSCRHPCHLLPSLVCRSFTRIIATRRCDASTSPQHATSSTSSACRFGDNMNSVISGKRSLPCWGPIASTTNAMRVAIKEAVRHLCRLLHGSAFIGFMGTFDDALGLPSAAVPRKNEPGDPRVQPRRKT